MNCVYVYVITIIIYFQTCQAPVPTWALWNLLIKVYTVNSLLWAMSLYLVCKLDTMTLLLHHSQIVYIITLLDQSAFVYCSDLKLSLTKQYLINHNSLGLGHTAKRVFINTMRVIPNVWSKIEQIVQSWELHNLHTFSIVHKLFCILSSIPKVLSEQHGCFSLLRLHFKNNTPCMTLC